MRSYEQYCAVAKALDIVGDRWTLLIVRELIGQGPCRYTDLKFGLPGIATNLLADRLRELEEAGIVAREAAPPPVATTLFTLTEAGKELMPVLRALGNWGVRFMRQPSETDQFRSHWLAYPARRLVDHSPGEPPIAIEVHTADQPMVIETLEGGVRARPGVAEHPDVVLTGRPGLILGLLFGQLDVATAKKRGLKVEGSVRAIRRVQGMPAAVV
jgi:DNA-binding HxlR family transcriptional regulator